MTPTAELLGVRLHLIDAPGLLGMLDHWLAAEPALHRLYYANAHVLNLAHADERFRQSLNRADFVLPEGFGCQLGARVAGIRHSVQSLNTLTWIDDYLRLAARRSTRLFLLGDEPSVVQRCAQRMQDEHPGLQVVGMHHGFFDPDGVENEHVVELIAASRPDVLIVGMGNPRQEFWIDANTPVLPPMSVLSLGALIRWYSGVERPWPTWMLRFHLAWLGRLAQHPIRHFRRYVIGNPLFLWRCLLQRFGRNP